MADNIKNRTYTGTGQTFEETFKGTTKGMSGYQDAVEALAKEYARLNGLSEEQRQWLEDYINGLDDVKNSWEQINDYVQEFVDDINTFTKDLSSVRNLFSNILKDLQPARRQATEQVNLLKNFRDLTGEIQRATVIQNGTSEASLRSLNRRVQKAKELYEWSVKSILDEGRYTDQAAARIGEESKVRALEDEKARLDGEVRRLQRRLQTQSSRGYANLNTKIELDQALKAQAEFNKTKLAELDLHRSNVELLQEEVRLGVEATAGASENLVQQRRRLGREHPGLNTAARLAEKFGVTGAKDELESYYQQMILAQRGEGPMPSKGALLGGWLKDAVTFAGIMTALGLTVTNIWRGLKDVSSEAAKLKQNIGTWQFGAAAANTEFATSVQWLQTASELAQQFGQDPTSFVSPEGIARLAEAKNLLGLSAEQAGNLGIRAKLAGQTSDSYNESLVQGINKGNALNRSAVAHGVALKEALAISDNLALSLGNSGDRIGRAVVAAKNLGLELKDVDRIAGSLLEFESSIENEMKAQLLTGQQMNLSRARALALQNDLEGVAKELTKQGMDAARFGNLNRIQQESFAKALGMSREELGRMLIEQEGLSKLTDKEIEKATGMKREQLEAMGITERWKTATEKLAQAFTPILTGLMPAIEGLSKLVAWIAGGIGKIFSVGGKGIGGAIVGVVGLTAAIVGLRAAARGIGGLLGGITGGGAASTAAGAAGKSRGLSRLGGGIAGFYRQFMGNKVTTQMIAKGKSALMGLALGTLALPFIAVAGPLGYVAGPGLAALGKGISVLFKALGHIPPQVLGTAAIALGIIGGFTVLLGGGIALAGLGMKLIGEGIGSISAGLKDITPDKVVALGGLSAAILSLSGVGILGSLGLLVLGLSLKPLVKQLTKMGAAAKNIGNLASNMRLLTASVGGLSSALNNFDDDKLETLSEVGGKVASAYNRSRATGTPETSIKSAATTAAEERMEKIVTGIANRLNSTLNVHVDNWDIDKISRQLAVETANDFR